MREHGRTISQAGSNGLLGWLGLGRDAHDEDERQSREDLARQARARLLKRISAFLLDHDLEITQANLAAAHGAFAGLNPGLERRIRKRIESGERIDQSWLDRATAAEAPVPDDAVDQLAQQLEAGIDNFSRSTRTARDATNVYGNALAEHVDALDARPDTNDVIASLADYARTMLERSRKAEEELRMAEDEAASLRRNLDRARRDAEMDFLTGLPNRRAFEALLEREYREAQAAVEPLCVAFCDIDLFKQVNDTHGHDAGDRVICVVADLLRAISGEKCHIARHGGEEFVLLMRGYGPKEAFALLDAERETLASRKLVNRRTKEPFGLITFSGGVADVFSYPDPRAALAAADEALHEAKQAGRNRIMLAKPGA